MVVAVVLLALVQVLVQVLVARAALHEVCLSAEHCLLDATVAVQARAKAQEVWDALSRVTVDHKTGDIAMNSQELQLACVWVLRGTVSSKAELELLEKCLTLKWADEAGRQLQHPEENLEHALAVSAAADMIQNADVDWTAAGTSSVPLRRTTVQWALS